MEEAVQKKTEASRQCAGYEAFSNWMRSDQDFAIYRRFGTLHTRAILYYQNEIHRLENELDELDKRSYDSKRLSIVPDLENSSKRSNIIAEIGAKIKNYHELLLRANTFYSST